jgi:hypothetical protein
MTYGITVTTLTVFGALSERNDSNMGRPRLIDKDGERLARRLYCKGLNDHEIGRRLHVASTTVLDWRRRHKLKPQRPHHRIDHIRALHEYVVNKLSAKEVAEKLGCSQRGVSHVLTKHNAWRSKHESLTLKRNGWCQLKRYGTRRGNLHVPDYIVKAAGFAADVDLEAKWLTTEEKGKVTLLLRLPREAKD